MRGCERGAGSADRAPAHRSREAILPYLAISGNGEALSGSCETISSYSEVVFDNSEVVSGYGEVISGNSKVVPGNNEVITGNGVAICNDGEILSGNEEYVSNDGEVVSGNKEYVSNCSKAINGHSEETVTNGVQKKSREAILRNSRKTILKYNEKTILRNNGKAILRNSKKVIRRDIGEAISKNNGETKLKYSRKAILRNSEEAKTRNSGEAILPRRTRGGAILLCLLLLLSLRGSSGSASLGAQLVCARAPLTEKQRALCRASPAAMAAIATGLRMAYAECRSQLSGRRWNCSGVGDGSHFSHVMPLATREAAYTYAITSAGVTHALSAACARGELPACGCAHRRRVVPGEQWEWSGGGAARCGEAAYGARLARRFLDARELERDARAVMNLHNNRLGRKMVKELVRRECKCHGVSGSCAVRTCWRALPPFRALAAALTDKYHRARMVTPVERGTTDDGRVNIQLVVKRPRGGAGRAARKNELVFLAASPSYCEPDAAAGSFGTHGRTCNNTSKGEEGCESLCCGRGYSTVRRAERVQCRCSFQWCCRVRCDTCLTRTELHVCN